MDASSLSGGLTEAWPWPPIIIPYLPPSANNIRVINWRQKRQFLTEEAQAFERRFLKDFIPNNTAFIAQLDKDAVYEVYYVFYFPRDEVLTKTFGAGKKDSAKSRYKKMDAENRLKFLSDCLSKAVGIDDSQFFAGGYRKMCCDVLPGRMPQIHIWVAPRELSTFGL